MPGALQQSHCQQTKANDYGQEHQRVGTLAGDDAVKNLQQVKWYGQVQKVDGQAKYHNRNNFFALYFNARF